MNVLDVAVVAVLATAVWGGYRLGLVTGATSFVFLLQGLVAASLASPALVEGLGGHGPAIRLVLGAVLFMVAGVGAQFLGRLVGREGVAFAINAAELRPLLSLDRSGTADTGDCF